MGLRRLLPAAHPPHDRILLFDGVCNLCSAWTKFLIPLDRQGKIHFASLQSETGQQILRSLHLPTDRFNTMMFVDDGIVYTKSDAFLRIVQYLPRPWSWLQLGVVLPRAIRNWCYDRIALNRYRLFGQSDSCMIPAPHVARRFLP